MLHSIFELDNGRSIWVKEHPLHTTATMLSADREVMAVDSLHCTPRLAVEQLSEMLRRNHSTFTVKQVAPQ